MTIETLAMQALVIIACILLACSVIENKFKKNAKSGWRDVGMGLEWTHQEQKHQTKRKHTMNATQIQIEQANCQSIIADLYSAAQQIAFDSEGAHDNALAVIEAIEDGRYLEAVMVGLNF